MQKRVLYIVIFTLFGACNHLTPLYPSRNPSAVAIDNSLSINFKQFLHSPSAEIELRASLEDLKSYYLRAESIMADFDGELADNKGSISLENSKPYKKLISIWRLKHQLQDKLTYNFIALEELMDKKGLELQEKKIASKLFNVMKKELNSSEPLNKLAYDEINQLVLNESKQRSGFYIKTFDGIRNKKIELKSESEKISLLRKYRDQFRKLGKKEHLKNDLITQQIESGAENLQLLDQAGREPQSQLVFSPGVGPNGNIMSMIFPKGVWALTFDDGPNPTYTPEILKNLEQAGIKATFFWLAENVIKYQSIVDSVGEKAMVRANHSWTHPQLPKLNDVDLDKEIVQSTKVETKSYGEPIRFFRCPYGAGNSVTRVRQKIADLNMLHVFWNVDTLDWQDKDPESILARAKKQMQANGHGVILFHDIHPQSVEASKKLIEWSNTLKGTNEEIRWVTLSEIVDEMNGGK